MKTKMESLVSLSSVWKLEDNVDSNRDKEPNDIKLLFQERIPPSYKGKTVREMIEFQRKRYGAVIYDPRKRLR